MATGDKKVAAPSSFEVHAMGQIESGFFPTDDNLYCAWSLHHGSDWQGVAGTEEGITQVASVPAGRPAKVVWNFPVDLTFKSTNVYGWPQLVLHVHGFRPVSSSPLQQLIGWLNGTPAEYVEQKRPAMANGREVTRVESTGVVTVKINVVTRNMKQFGYSLPLATNV